MVIRLNFEIAGFGLKQNLHFEIETRLNEIFLYMRALRDVGLELYAIVSPESVICL